MAVAHACGIRRGLMPVEAHDLWLMPWHQMWAHALWLMPVEERALKCVPCGSCRGMWAHVLWLTPVEAHAMWHQTWAYALWLMPVGRRFPLSLRMARLARLRFRVMRRRLMPEDPGQPRFGSCPDSHSRLGAGRSRVEPGPDLGPLPLAGPGPSLQVATGSESLAWPSRRKPTPHPDRRRARA